jgi:hypothetical protein
MDITGKTNFLNSYYEFAFCCNRNIPEIKLTNSGELFIINTQVIRKRLTKIWRNNPLRSDGVPGEILKLGGEAMT